MSTHSKSEAKSRELLDLIASKFKDKIQESKIELGDAVIKVDRSELVALCGALKSDKDMEINYLVDLTVVDWMDVREERFEAVYHLLGLNTHYRLRIKVAIPEEDARIDSIAALWAGANFMEREAWDMYGVVFTNHPDLRRILTYDEFEGYPLRKDYPVQGKQPRVPMLNPEVRNTAVDMQRPALVSIGGRKREAGGVQGGGKSAVNSGK